MCVSSFFCLNCKMHLIIVYSEAKKTTKKCYRSSIWSWDCHVRDHNPETLIMYQSCCRAHSHTSGWFLKENPREYFTCDLQECFMLSSKAFAALAVQILKFRWCSLCFKKSALTLGPFHLRRDCRPVCVWPTCPVARLWFVSAHIHLGCCHWGLRRDFFFSNLTLFMSC